MSKERQPIKARLRGFIAHLGAMHAGLLSTDGKSHPYNPTDVSRETPKIPLWDKRLWLVLLSGTAILVLYHYYGHAHIFHRKITKIAPWTLELVDKDLFPLLPWMWWAVASFALRILLPLLLIVAVLRESPAKWGFSPFVGWKHTWIYVLLYLAILPVIWFVSQDPAFLGTYPFYRGAIENQDHFVLYEACYLTQFLALEAFFRGFLVFGLYRSFGYYALFIAAMPYCFIHWGKPMPETLSAIAAGVLLGWLALKTGQIYLGWFLHAAVALTMDILAVSQLRG